MTVFHPERFDIIDEWAREHDLSVDEARERFAQFSILVSIANDPHLRSNLVMKGGNALDFVWQTNRSTRDLDFSVAPELDPEILTASIIKDWLDHAFLVFSENSDVLLQTNSVRQNPPGPQRTFITYEARVAYALPDQAKLKTRLSRGIPGNQMIPIDISVNELVCADQTIPVGATGSLRVSTIEDIVSEKLRAILQQPLRRRSRSQDVLDIAVAINGANPPDPSLVSQFLLAKTATREVHVSKSAFQDEAIKHWAGQRYDVIAKTVRTTYYGLDEAIAIVRAFVLTLDIPED